MHENKGTINAKTQLLLHVAPALRFSKILNVWVSEQ
jgi:hypothetical protein